LISKTSRAVRSFRDLVGKPEKNEAKKKDKDEKGGWG